MKSTYSKILVIAVLVFSSLVTKAQYTALDFNKMDCNGTDMHHLFADLDSGKAVLLHFFMPNCGSCPPPARILQNMAMGINDMHPGMVKGYAFPYINSTTCAYAASWVSSNNLSTIYTPMDSGAAGVANYGGFGMPTVVVLGGMDHRVLFVSQAFSSSDTTTIKDSIMGLMSATTGVIELPNNVSSFKVFPNPAVDNLSINVALTEATTASIDISDMAGKQVAVVMKAQSINGQAAIPFNTRALPAGTYTVRLTANNKSVSQKLTVTH
ncbi:MAG: T9SS type A sorting domain-containing protein [Bacteroidetes bacterium]|nr:T9SS type A sorting domain-containing protein [Bacteroidota bacterium]